MGDDNRWNDDQNRDWGDRYRREERADENRRYGAGDYEQARQDDRYGQRQRGEEGWSAYEPGRQSPDYNDRSGPRGWERAAEQGYGPRRENSGSEGQRRDFGGWDAPFGGHPMQGRETWERLRNEGRSFLDKTREEIASLASMFGSPKREDGGGERAQDAQPGQQAGAYRGLGPRGYRRSDERIREDVNDQLTEDPHLDASDIEVHVMDGEVTLNGQVRSRADKRRAEDIADRVSGVHHVQNNLRPDRDDRQRGQYRNEPPSI